MDFYTSYFYQIRNFTPNMIPLSTACSDPAWYHAGRDKNFVYFDNNKVCNGLRAEMLHPDKSCANLCCGGFACPYTPDTCNFLDAYRKQLEKVDFMDFIARCARIKDQVRECNHFEGPPIIVLMVHEAPQNPCSERIVLQEWMWRHGMSCPELPYQGKQFRGFFR